MCTVVEGVDKIVIAQGRKLGARKLINGQLLSNTILQPPALDLSCVVNLEIVAAEVSFKLWSGKFLVDGVGNVVERFLRERERDRERGRRREKLVSAERNNVKIELICPSPLGSATFGRA